MSFFSALADVMELIKSNHPDLGNRGFAHLANVCGIDQSPFELPNGLSIRKATASESQTLHAMLEILRTRLEHLPGGRNPYEALISAVETQPGVQSIRIVQLPKQEWRYHVIDFSGSNHGLLNLTASSVLTKSRLKLGPSIMGHSLGMGPAMIDKIHHGFWDDVQRSDDDLLCLSTDNLEDLRYVLEKLANTSPETQYVHDAIGRFQQLDSIPKASPLRFLGVVSVLESLITHLPDKKDPYDSLTRQVRQKMLLVGNRAKLPFPYDLFAPGVGHDTLWTKLYDYRSKVAHGGAAEFSGNLQCLKGPAVALEFMTCVTTSLMRQALEEPQLIADLKVC